jgi:exopolysaccharide biosynthesis polyprenyl glycosylphosphotransferase
MSPQRRALLTLVKLSDLAAVTASFVIAVAATAPDTGGWLRVLEMRIKLQNVFFVAAYLGLWHVVLNGCGLYRSYRLSTPTRELRDLGSAVLIAIAPLALLAELLHFQYVTTPFFLTFASVAFVAVGLQRRVLRAVGRRVRRYGRNLANVVIVGTGNVGLELTAQLARREDLGYQVVEVIEASNGNGASPHADVAVVKRVAALLEQRPIDEIFIALPLDTSQLLIRQLVALCEEQGVTVRVMAHVASLYWARAIPDEIEGQPVLTIHTGPPDTLRLVVKRAIDLAGALVGLGIFATLFLVIAIAIKLDSTGPVFFAQERVGLNRRRFRAYKFRTMREGAEHMQAALEPLNEADGPVFKIENDPRVTRIGKWLRRLSLDELPQLVNVLKGEMSLVGPRPLPVRDVSRIDVRWHKRRFSVKPGITCLWQVNSRLPKFDEWIRSDMEYIDNWSLALDLKILVKTIPAVLSGQGAH